MKKFLKISLFLLFTSNVLQASVCNVINTTTDYTLYFYPHATGKNTCYPKFRAYNPSGLSSYCVLPADSAIAFSTFTQLGLIYPGLTCTRQLSATAATTNVSQASASTYFTNTSLISAYNVDWSAMIYKVENSTTTEGAWMRFGDFASCFSGWEEYVSYTNTEAYTTYTIGAERYFVVSDL
jgi:hypothetical protein